MSLIGLLITVIVIGLIAYLLNMLPLPQPWKQIAIVVFVLIIIIYLVSGLTGHHALVW